MRFEAVFGRGFEIKTSRFLNSPHKRSMMRSCYLIRLMGVVVAFGQREMSGGWHLHFSVR
jgi:hypothetical protein